MKQQQREAIQGSLARLPIEIIAYDSVGKSCQLGSVSKHVVAPLRDAKCLRLGETQLRERLFTNRA